MSVRTGGIGCVAQSLKFGVNRLTITQTSYDDQECRGRKIGEIRTEGPYALGDKLPQPHETRSLDFTIEKVMVIPFVENWGWALSIDFTADCELSDMTVGAPLEVTGKDSGSLGRMPVRGNIYATSIPVDRGGRDFHGTSPGGSGACRHGCGSRGTEYESPSFLS